MKNRCTLFTALMLITASRLLSQNYIDYYNLANEAEHQFADGDLHTARNILLGLEKEYFALKPIDNFYMGIIHYFLQDTAVGHSYLIRSVQTGFPASKYIFQYHVHFTYFAIPAPVTDQLLAIEGRVAAQTDQKIADTLTYFIDKYQLYASDTIFYAGKARRVQLRFLQFIKEQGVPNPYLYGDAGMMGMALNVQASRGDSAMYNAYADLYYGEVIKGNLSAYYYCRLVDRSLAADSETRYGTDLVKANERTTKQEIIANRRSIGMSTYYEGPGQLRPKYPKFQN